MEDVKRRQLGGEQEFELAHSYQHNVEKQRISRQRPYIGSRFPEVDWLPYLS